MRTVSKLFIVSLVIGALALVGCSSSDTAVSDVAPVAPAPAAAAAAAAAPAAAGGGAAAAPAAPAAPAAAAPAAAAAKPEHGLKIGAITSKTAPIRSIPPTPSSLTVKTGGTIRWSGHGGLDTVDHWGTTAGISHAFSSQWNDFLIGWDSQANPQPQMLEGWTLDSDGLTHRFTLREGLKFWDGSAITTDDVLASLDKWHTQIDPVPKQVWDLGTPTQAKVDGRTFTLTMSEPFGVMQWNMGTSLMSVIPAALAAKYPQSEPIPWEEIVGAGPLTIADYSPGNVAHLAKWAAYNSRTEPKAGNSGSREHYADGLKLIDVPDGNTKMAALETGQLDVVDRLPNDFLDIVRENKSLVAIIMSPDHSPGIFLNKSIPPLNHVKARVALQLVINYREAMLAFGPADMMTLGHQVFVIGGTWDMDAGIDDMFESNENFGPTPAMLARATKLWNEAAAETGWDVSQPIEMMNATNIAHYGSLVVAKQNMEDAGFPVNMPAMDWATVASRSSSDCDWNIAITGWNAFDPVSNPGFSTTWKCGWDNQEVQDLIKDFTKASTLAEQKDIVAKIQIAKINDPPYIHFGQLNGMHALGANVRNFENFLQIVFAGVWLDD